MADWFSSMRQTFEYYMVDPGTWCDVRLIDTVTSCTIDRDKTSGTLGSATIDITEDIGECYIRAYLVTVQNGRTEKHALGTFLVQTPSVSFDGKVQSVSLDAYTPLMELKEKLPPIGYTIMKGANIMDIASELCEENARAPVVVGSSSTKLFRNFVAAPQDNWLSFLTDLIGNSKFEFELDEMGRILFAPVRDTASLRPVWTYDDGNSSILYPDVSVNRDLYGIPNVVEVSYSVNSEHFYARAVNKDRNSPISTVNRGREIVYRETEPQIIGNPTKEQLNEYAEQLLCSLSSLEYTLTYTHGYCPVRIGDCVRLNYVRAGLTNIKAKVISQSIKCESGCPVTETAVFTTKLWG